MTGQLVIAELEAFRTVLSHATLHDGEKIKLWSRSTIANALHRVGPTDALKAAAEQAWAEADDFAMRLAEAAPSNIDGMRHDAVHALDVLIAVVRETKASHPGGPTPTR